MSEQKDGPRWALTDHAKDRSMGALPHNRARTDPRENVVKARPRPEHGDGLETYGTAEGISHISKQNIQECKMKKNKQTKTFSSF